MVCGLCHVLRNDVCTAVSVPSLRINRRPVVSKRHNATKATLWGSSLDLTFYIQISLGGGGRWGREPIAINASVHSLSAYPSMRVDNNNI